jgi:hypothetical protein
VRLTVSARNPFIHKESDPLTLWTTARSAAEKAAE